ncbi:MAG: hypothetical protein JETCAE03_34690 [Ignavibacteriaceae bacterium]|jgi:hypothetical protein|nr:MAG: hypothetical protein JETCAE03_34690 [Ignavibacteriaceae bacterium]
MAYRFKKNYYVTETCECGAKRHVKDHGSWIGFYCPTCEQGGSRSKHERKHFSKHSRDWAHTLPPVTQKASLSEIMGNDAPLSLYEHCAQESGLSGQALVNYINKYLCLILFALKF